MRPVVAGVLSVVWRGSAANCLFLMRSSCFKLETRLAADWVLAAGRAKSAFPCII
jgi:hypothetical protein